MNKNPLVSVVVVTYNDSAFIIETLESIKKQTYSNIELIVSDDGSNDDTVKLVKEWVRFNSYSFVSCKVMEVTKNTGVTRNYQRAEKAASGIWLKTIGGDDILYPNCISEHVRYVSNNDNVDVVVCRQELIDENGDKMPISTKGTNYYSFFRASNTIQRQFLLRFDPIEDTCLFKSKKMMEDINYYDCDFPMQEDTPLKMKIALGGFKYWNQDQFLLAKRMRAGSLSGKSDKRLIVNNDIVRKEINKKYYIPQLSGIEKLMMIYDGWVVSFFFSNPLVNNKNLICRMLLLVLRFPVRVLKEIKINKLKTLLDK